MARDSGGTYTLPAGNPVVTGTTITSTWGNTTMSDIATELSDSLSRSGKGGMSNALGLVDGSVSAPGLTFNSDPNTGIFRPTADALAITTNGVERIRFDANGVDLSNAGGSLTIDSGGATGSILILKNTEGSARLVEDGDTFGIYKADADGTSNAELAISAVGDAGVSLYFNNTVAFQTTAAGAKIDTAGTAAQLIVEDATGQQGQLYKNDAGAFDVLNAATSGNVRIAGINSGGFVQHLMFTGDPDGAAQLNYNNTKAIATTSTGADVQSTGANPNLVLKDSGGNQIVTLSTSNDDLYLEPLQNSKGVYIRVNDAGTQENAIRAIPAGAVILYYDNAQKLTTVTGGVSVTGSLNVTDDATTRQNLNLEIGLDVQAYDLNLSQIAALTPTSDNFIVGNGSAWTLETPAQARTSLGVTDEFVEDIAGLLVASGGTKTGITVSYQDSTGDMDFIVDTATTGQSGIGEIATQAEVDAGTDSARWVTPATLKNMSEDTWGASTLSGNGFYALPGGFVISWGTATGSDPITVTYPTGTNYTTVYSVQCQYMGDTADADDTYGVTSFDATNFTINFKDLGGSGGTKTFEWMALGVR